MYSYALSLLIMSRLRQRTKKNHGKNFGFLLQKNAALLRFFVKKRGVLLHASKLNNFKFLIFFYTFNNRQSQTYVTNPKRYMDLFLLLLTFNMKFMHIIPRRISCYRKFRDKSTIQNFNCTLYFSVRRDAQRQVSPLFDAVPDAGAQSGSNG